MMDISKQIAIIVYFLTQTFTAVFALGPLRLLTTSGHFQGSEVPTRFGSVARFYGVPYAFPPIGPNRFLPSNPILTSNRNEFMGHPDNRQMILRPTPPPICPQILDFQKIPTNYASKLEMSEDCLKLNIYQPLLHYAVPTPPPVVSNQFKYTSPREKVHPKGTSRPFSTKHKRNIGSHPVNGGGKLPILVWIPGNGVTAVDGAYYDGSTLAALGKMIVIILHYRVGVFGFLSSPPNATVKIANAGVSDIISALEWIRENGPQFNGNVSCITVAGRFTGLMTLSTVLMSPKFIKNYQEPLVSRVVFHGGVPVNPWFMNIPPDDLTIPLGLATNCSEPTPGDRIGCLQNLTMETLLNASVPFSEKFGPVTDNDYIWGDPLEQLESGNFPFGIDVMVGDNSATGYLCYTRFGLYNNASLLKAFSDNSLGEAELYYVIQRNLKDFFYVDDPGLAAIVAHEFMLSMDGTSRSYKDAYQRFCMSLLLNSPSEFSARFITRSGSNKVYRYRFNFEPKSAHDKWWDTDLGDEIGYFLHTSLNTMNGDFYFTYYNFSQSFINFVKTGNPGAPGQTWPVFDEKYKSLIRFDEGGAKLASSRTMDRDIDFWQRAFPRLLASFRKFANRQENLTKELAASSNHVETYPDPPDDFFVSFIITAVLLCTACIVIVYMNAVRYLRPKKKKTRKNSSRSNSSQTPNRPRTQIEDPIPMSSRSRATVVTFQDEQPSQHSRRPRPRAQTPPQIPPPSPVAIHV